MEKIQSKIADFLRTGAGNFESLALELFAYQFELNRPYQSFCRLQYRTPQTVSRWQDIPAVHINAFKSADLVTFPIGRAAARFQSSGTTAQSKSNHYLKTLSYYEESVKTGFAAAFLPDQARLPFLILAPSPAEAPRSSLSWMLDVVKRSFGTRESIALVQRGRLDEAWLVTLLKKYEAQKMPVALLGTTISLAGFFDSCERMGSTFRLAAGSRVMDTGGMKTEKRELTRSTFVSQISDYLGIPELMCVNEYGMCELSSQFYGKGANSFLAGPAWTRTIVIEPATGEPALAGSPGLLRHFDLANVDSVLAIQTEDVGVADGDGFVLQGRDPSADVKGCSLSAEAFLV